MYAQKLVSLLITTGSYKLRIAPKRAALAVVSHLDQPYLKHIHNVDIKYKNIFNIAGR